MQGQSFEYGGVKFTKNVPDDAIRTFVSRLPQDKRKDLREIVYELEDAGLLTIEIPGEAPRPLAAPEAPAPPRAAASGAPARKAASTRARTQRTRAAKKNAGGTPGGGQVRGNKAGEGRREGPDGGRTIH